MKRFDRKDDFSAKLSGLFHGLVASPVGLHPFEQDSRGTVQNGPLNPWKFVLQPDLITSASLLTARFASLIGHPFCDLPTKMRQLNDITSEG